jgi:hypothetical protein
VDYIVCILSPRYLLYTKIGENNKPRQFFDLDLSNRIQEIIINHSYRYIYAEKENKTVKKISPRIISKEQYDAERDNWQIGIKGQSNVRF